MTRYQARHEYPKAAACSTITASQAIAFAKDADTRQAVFNIFSFLQIMRQAAVPCHLDGDMARHARHAQMT